MTGRSAISERDAAVLESALAALAHEPGNGDALRAAAEVLLWHRAADRLISLCDRALAKTVEPALALAMRALALGQKNAGTELAEHVDPDRFLTIVPNVVNAEFNAELTRQLCGDPRRSSPSSRYATRGGERVANLEHEPGPALSAFLATLEQHAAAYVRNTPLHPAYQSLRGSLSPSVRAWALFLSGLAHEAWHIHPGSFVSGVYYLSVPPGEGGALEFGPLPIVPHTDRMRWPRRTIAPVPGTLLIFPAHLAHRSHATGSEEVRISMSFDVAP